ncbi:MAG: patatin-like phospholipase family protein [Gammaproteobacteria bacterium]|nr:patatin-like phospholipase family protein [Gammaproteobacteria bacterium]
MIRGAQKLKKGLVLPGGGARAAYQVGVLRAVAEMIPHGSPSPFPIVSGTSAGAINSAVLASNADNYRLGVTRMTRVWRNFRAHHVYRTDGLTMLRTSLHWLLTVISGGVLVKNPNFLLDSSPLRELLARDVDFDMIAAAIEHGSLDALAITASGYSSAKSISFYQARPGHRPWHRTRREGRADKIGLDHLMASAAMPVIFAPVRIGREYFGDGAMRQATPLSTAIHLGADRLLVISVRDETGESPRDKEWEESPSLGRIAGYMLDTLLMDGLYADLERITRINNLLENLPQQSAVSGGRLLRRIDCLVIVPSEDIREIALKHAHELPRSVRILLRGMGAMNRGGRQLISYLLFESGFTRDLIRLGYSDGKAQEETLRAFLYDEPMSSLSAPKIMRVDLSGEEKGPEAEE